MSVMDKRLADLTPRELVRLFIGVGAWLLVMFLAWALICVPV